MTDFLSDDQMLALQKSGHATPGDAAAPAHAPDFISDDDFQKAQNPRPKHTLVESAISGLARGMTFGYSPQIAGAGRAVVGKLTGDDHDFGDLYRKYRDEQQRHVDENAEDNPGTMLGSEVVGGVVSPITKVIGPTAGAGAAMNIGKAALAGGIAGGGYSKADLTKGEVGDFAKDVGKGAAIGGVIQGGGEVVGKVAKAMMPKNLSGYAEEQAVKAAGAMKRDMNDLESTGQLNKVGRQLLDQKVVRPLSSLEDVAEKAGQLKQTAGQDIGNTLSKVDDLASKAKEMIDDGKLFADYPDKAKAKDMIDRYFQFNMQKIGQRIRSEIIQPNAENPLLEGELGKMDRIASSFETKNPQSLTFGNTVKGTAGKQTRFASDTLPETFKQQVYGVINSELENLVANTPKLEKALQTGEGALPEVTGQVEAAAPKSEGEVLKAYQAAKSKYGAMKQAEDMATDRLGAVRSNRGISLTDTIAGAAGLAHGGPPTAIALGALNKFGRQYGASLRATGADALSKGIEKLPGSYAEYIEELAKRSGLSSATTQYLLEQEALRRGVPAALGHRVSQGEE